nr:hypothetical protein [Devosia marina]
MYLVSASLLGFVVGSVGAAKDRGEGFLFSWYGDAGTSGGADGRPQSVCETLEQFIAMGVSHVVVDQLELIEVKYDDGGTCPG